jgi:hypothetical protein
MSSAERNASLDGDASPSGTKRIRSDEADSPPPAKRIHSEERIEREGVLRDLQQSDDNRLESFFKSLTCCVCQELMHRPIVVCTHGHSACDGCVTGIFATTRHRCPQCREQINRIDLRPNRAVAAAVAQMRTHCVACRAQIEANNADTHATVCPKRYMKCTPCGAIVPMSEAERHFSHQCPASCRCLAAGCAFQGSYSQLQAHTCDTAKVLLRCPNRGCRYITTLSKLLEHLPVCDNAECATTIDCTRRGMTSRAMQFRHWRESHTTTLPLGAHPTGSAASTPPRTWLESAQARHGPPPALVLHPTLDSDSDSESGSDPR